MGQACKIKGRNQILTLYILVLKLQLMVPGLIGHPGAVVTLSVKIQGKGHVITHFHYLVVPHAMEMTQT